MKHLKVFLSISCLCLCTLTFAQDKEQKTMHAFAPKSQAYNIYYPLGFQLLEGDDGIVTITDTLSGLNITLSSYTLPKKPKDIDIIAVLNAFINDTYNKQHQIEDWKSYKTKFDNLVVLKTNFDHSNWIWYGINTKKTLVILSLDKEREISQDDVNLVMFIIDNMIIN